MRLDNSNIKPLDGLRGYSILLVLISHIGFGHIVPGGFGVTIFFFVSGFLICKLLLNELNETKTVNFYLFYLRRFFRLYPALIFFLVLLLILFFSFKEKIYISEFFASLFYYMNYNMVFFRTNHSNLISAFNILWSLSIEEHFYVLFPFTLVQTYKNKLLFIIICGSVCMLCLIFRVYYGLTLSSNQYEDYNYHLTHTRIDAIMYGCITAFILYHSPDGGALFLKFVTNKYVLIISFFALIFCLLFRNHFFRETFRYSLQGIALSCIVVNIVYEKIPSISFLFNTKVIVFIGRLSYSLYLFHWLCISFASQIVVQYSEVWYFIVIPSTLCLSLFSYFYIEKPFVGLRKKLGSNV